MKPPSRGKRSQATVTEAHGPGASIAGALVAHDVAARLHVLDDLPGPLLGHLQEPSKLTHRARAIAQETKDQAVRLPHVIEAVGSQIGVQSAHKPLVGQQDRDADV